MAELRGFAPIGILEEWNSGIMGLGEEKKTKYDFFRFYCPAFHHSKIPSFHGTIINLVP